MVSSLISSEDLERAAVSTVPLPLAGQSPEARVKSGTLYYLLVLLCTGKAQVIMRTVEVGNGVEGWRVLSARYDRRDTTSTTGLLQAILGFEMSDDLERIPDKLAEFELMVQRYNMTSGEVAKLRKPRFSGHCQNLSSHICWSILNDSPMEQKCEQLSETI